ncbi:hypothetical protein [Endozoicomonas euniceicola]|uniref:Uncharacterized protein n=1 Tax=Endozoicomonas euniceicola TaxID=1234143 RepID=A0ABY6GPZ3_9GAMM|nr:hypothetical protein [Endozoicomonas euniceicola]UYM14802.1 hypothetical protein NX720_18165 [Endozoicomonas euniceicola]
MNEMENARLMLDYSRLFFKGSLKTGNKTYSLRYGTASEEKKLKRRTNHVRALHGVGFLRKEFPVFPDQVLGKEFAKHEFLSAMSQGKRSGNCQEYNNAALIFGYENKVQNIWLILHKEHEFLVLATDPGLSDTLVLSEFCQYKDYNYWVCDSWFNIHCKIDLYGLMVNSKSSQWELEGKEIFITETCIAYSEKATQWCQKLFIGDMQAIRMTDSSGQPTDAFKGLFEI